MIWEHRLVWKKILVNNLSHQRDIWSEISCDVQALAQAKFFAVLDVFAAEEARTHLYVIYLSLLLLRLCQVATIS